MRGAGGRRQARTWLAALALLALAAGCRRGLVRPERLDEPAMRAWISGNYSPLRALDISWRGVYQDAEREIPFRLDLSWCPDSAHLSLRSPFGGELARASCRPGERVAAETGKPLARWLGRAVSGVQDPGLRRTLDAGLLLLTGETEVGGLKVEVLDPTLLPLLAGLEGRLPESLQDGSLCERAVAAPWLWGEWIPAPGASWQPAARRFSAGEDSWTVDRRTGMVARAVRGGWVMEMDQFTREQGLWLAGRLRLGRPREDRRLVLQRRECRLSVAERR